MRREQATGCAELEELSTREMQACGAACLARFCGAKGISSPLVLDLVEHLLAVLVATDLGNWEQAGAELVLCGRGEPLPDEIIDTLPPDLLDPFERLVDVVVEIGMIDLYGADTRRPGEFLVDSLKVLRAHGVAPPDLDELLPGRPRERRRGWGKPTTRDEYERARRWTLTALGARSAG